MGFFKVPISGASAANAGTSNVGVSRPKDGLAALDRYFDALVSGEDQTARFFPRADNLAAYLVVVEKRLGSYAQRLSASVGDDELTAELVADAEAQTLTAEMASSRTRTPWCSMDAVSAMS
jgi:hypothetical protein